MIKCEQYIKIDIEKIFKEDIQKMDVEFFKCFASFLDLKDLEKVAKWWDTTNQNSYFSAIEYVQELERTLK